MFFLSEKRLDFFCFLAKPGALHVPESVLDCLTNIALGCLLGYRVSIIMMRLVQAVFFFKKYMHSHQTSLRVNEDIINIIETI